MKRPALRYRVEALNHRAHLFAITLEIDRPAARQKLALPVWIPGSYLVREFSQHLQSLQASQGGAPLPVKQLDKHRWQVDNDGQRTLSLGGHHGIGFAMVLAALGMAHQHIARAEVAQHGRRCLARVGTRFMLRDILRRQRNA